MFLPPESRKFLLYARQIEIRGVDIDNPYYNYIISFTVPDIDNVTVVDYDAVEQRIYWSDVRTQTIKRAFINGTGVETVVSAGGNKRTHASTHNHTRTSTHAQTHTQAALENKKVVLNLLAWVNKG